MKLGILDLAMSGWSAGRSYSRGLACSLHQAGADVAFLTRDGGDFSDGPKAIVVPEPAYLPGEWTLRTLIGLGRRNPFGPVIRETGLSVVGPVLQPEQLCPKARNVAWVPDFQPFVLPDLYTEQERQKIGARTHRLLRQADRVILSSEDSLAQMKNLFPDFASKARVLPFPSNFTFSPPAVQDMPVREKYHLPEKFLLVANQFWKHKNHAVVANALGIMKRRGKKITCVMTGLPADFRDPDNGVLSALLQAITAQDVNAECRVLGLVSRPELLALLRSATLLVQPSLFEGWNTTVQDAKALGCPLLLSDLPVHREQAPDARGFFDSQNAESLADALDSAFESLPVRPQREAEQLALDAEKAFAAHHGRKAREIFEIF